MILKNRILAFDVSNNRCSVAISIGQDIIAYEEDLRNSVQSEVLVPLIEKSLKSVNYNYSQIDYLALTKGPGSFTGIRVGLSAAEGILAASNIEGVAISNFEMSYYRLITQVKSFDKAIILLNAYRDQLYYQEFDNSGKKKNYGTTNVDGVSLLLSDHKNSKTVCAGSGAYKILKQRKIVNSIMILPRFAAANAIQVCRLADCKVQKKEFGTLDPLYIRPVNAQIPRKPVKVINNKNK